MALVGAPLVSVIGSGIVWLAVRRPALREPRADNALRLRSARVGIGLTMAILGFLLPATGTGIGILAGVLCWVATVNPPRVLVAAAVERV